jgi:WD40 repeat protein
VALIGDDYILSASDDHTVCISELSSSTVVARIKLSFPVNCAASLPDGRLAVCGREGSAALVDAPAWAAGTLTAHGAAPFPDAAAGA